MAGFPPDWVAGLLRNQWPASSGITGRFRPEYASQRSPQALRKAHRKRTDEGDPVHSFQTLLSDLATISKNRIQPQLPGSAAFDKITRPTSLQQRALDLLGVRL